MIQFQINDPSLESQWRSIILFGKNSATYKFAFANALLDLIHQDRTSISLVELAVPFSKCIIDHLRNNDKQGSSSSSKFLETCRNHIAGGIDKQTLYDQTVKFGFINVVDAFHVVNRKRVPNRFYEKDYSGGKRQIILTDHLFKLRESFQIQNFKEETESRWRLVETAWNLAINPNLLEVQYDENGELLYLLGKNMRRIDVTSVRSALNGYQKGKCFYSFRDISVISGSPQLCRVDHFLPHLNKSDHLPANINGIWNLVLANKEINGNKYTYVPELKYLYRLFKRNEFFIESKHPLAETIINQTGKTTADRRSYLERHYNIALQNSIHTWRPMEELEATF